MQGEAAPPATRGGALKNWSGSALPDYYTAETFSQILSGMVQRYKEKEDSNANRNMERLEMAHIRLEAALETSEKWHIIDASLLRWHGKLKRAAQECDDTLHKCKQRIIEDEQMEQEVRNSSLPDRIAHATKSFVVSVFNRNNRELSRSVVQRFEWFADEKGTEASLIFIQKDGRKELTQLPTRDLPWVPSVYQREHRNILHGLASQWFRPNPLCCKQLDQHENTSLSEDIISLQHYPYLKAGISFAPHRISEDTLPANRSSAIVAIVGEEQHCLHTDITLEQLEDIMLPKAIDYFRQHVEATVYQMLWKSKHGSALIQLRRLLMDWVQKEKEWQLIAPRLYMTL
ncbi:hypothetical protein BAE44_0015730 [Dichanthelium oligosanthes]|uniref:Rx N-terminal domain-containing protein n=1 Tax=Dichanthelium oligosanthes TaxID=888268 RepID=A0A1E5VDR2_9POAL|nr:hypothetical protein BAE44_0015730 [Dichanthelium oligosanthes]